MPSMIGVPMKRSMSAVFVAVALLSVVLMGQEKPSFAGTWKLADEAQADMFTPPQIVVVQDGVTLTVTVTSQMGEFKTIYKLDGTEAKSPIEFNGTTIDRLTKATWDGNKLLFTVTSEVQGQSFQTTGIWQLAPDGSLLTETTRP